MQLPESAVVAIKQALDPAIRIIAERSADTAAHILLNYGIPVTEMQVDDLMAIAATARIGSLAAIGFFDYVPLEDSFSLAAEHVAKTYRDPEAAARVKKVGLIYNALLIDLHNFTPMYQMIDSAITANGTEVTFAPILTLGPCSEGALRWARELGSPLHYRVPTPSLPPAELRPLATKIAIEAIREKELMDEDDAALLLSCTGKSLGNRRRENRVNRSVFIQDKPNGKIRYRKVELLTAIRNNTLFVTPKPGNRK